MKDSSFYSHLLIILKVLYFIIFFNLKYANGLEMQWVDFKQFENLRLKKNYLKILIQTQNTKILSNTLNKLN